MGTSAPELFASLQAAWNGDGSIAIGNVLGSNVANLGLALGLTALIAASLTGHLDMVSFLCEAGADKDKAVERWNPLIAASRSGHLDVVRFLCEAGADKDKGQDSQPPLIAA